MSAFGALIPPGAVQRIAMPVTADRADKAIGPFDMIQILCTGFFIRKPLEKLRKTHGLLEGFACYFLLIHNGTTFTVPLLYIFRCPIKRTFTASRPVLFKADSLKHNLFNWSIGRLIAGASYINSSRQQFIILPQALNPNHPEDDP